MPDRRIAYLIELRELERLVADIRSGAADDLDTYLANRTTVWTAVQDTQGRDVDVLVLRPSLTAGSPVIQ